MVRSDSGKRPRPDIAMTIQAFINMAAALGVVLGLILISAWLMRRFGLGGLTTARTSGPARLSVVEVRALDMRRQLVLVRRDGVEHLLVLSAAGETVVETGIPARKAAP
jgi:flagellar protein FliO/FliZ